MEQQIDLNMSWFAYHSIHGVKQVYSFGEYQELLATGWVDSPAKFGEEKTQESIEEINTQLPKKRGRKPKVKDDDG